MKGLVVTRKPGECILIGDDVRVWVSKIDKGGRVTLTVNAPQHIKVLREELIVRAARAQA